MNKSLSRRAFLRTSIASGASLAAAAAGAAPAGIYRPGTYSAKASGIGEVTVTMTFDADRIIDVVLDVSHETPGIGQAAADTLKKNLMAAQAAEIDGVSGATITSKAVSKAAAKCIAQAKGEIPVEVISDKKADEDDGDWLGKEPEIAEKDIVATHETDILVVGCGTGGLFAVAAAAEAGGKVIGIDRFAVGTGIREDLGAIDSRYQKAHGIKTTAQQVLDAALQFHHFRADPAVLRVLIEESTRTIDEIIDMGVELRGIRTMYPKEESLMCWHLFKGGTAEVIRRWIENIKARGGELLTNTRVTKLIMTDGRVTGVEATTKSGDKLIIHAKKVIIATGGFAANKEMLAQYVFDSSALGMIEPIWLRSPVVDGRTGDGINMARLVGAGVAGMHAVAGNAPYLPDTPPINQFSGPDELKQGRCALAQPWLWVDHTGRRFFNESRGSVFVDVYNAMTTAGGVSYTIFDQKMMDRMINKGAVLPFNAIVLADTPLKALSKTWEIGKERGWAFKADSIEELAQQIGVPPENLKDTMKKVNGYAEKGHDPEFGRKPEHLVKFDLEHGPYYALKAIRAFFLTLGGVQVTPAFEAKTPQGDVIPNLYVIGQDIGGLYDSSYDLRCEGSASSFAMTSGRYAAEHALKRIQEGK